MWRAISRPWRDIQAQCQPSMPTARNSTVALNSSEPMPEAASRIASANSATRQAPTTPPPMPVNTHPPRPRMPLVAAMTMPTTSAASSTSRKTTTALGVDCGRRSSIAAVSSWSFLLHDDNAHGVVLIDLADELVGAGLQRTNFEARFLAAANHFLDVQRLALEFLGCVVGILDRDRHFLTGGNLQLRRLEL